MRELKAPLIPRSRGKDWIVGSLNDVLSAEDAHRIQDDQNFYHLSPECEGWDKDF